MPPDIAPIRRQMKLVGSLLRQEKPVSAVQAVVAGLRLMLTTPLIKAEKEEFADRIREALGFINNDAEIRKIYPLELRYQSGEEKRLLDELQELLDVFGEEAM